MDRRIVAMNAEWMREKATVVKERWMGVAFVFPGEFFRFVLSTIVMAAPTTVPYKVFGTTQEAGEWVSNRLRDAGVLPPVLRDRLVD